MTQTAPLTSLFSMRSAFRAGRLSAVLDATSYDNLLAEIGRAGLGFDSLFTGEDALMLSGEAPYVVSLDPAKPRAVRDLLQAARYPHAGFIVDAAVTRDELRRHYASWLHVTLNGGAEMALFRFYDTRMLLTLLATLSATDAAAFWGPAARLVVIDQAVPAVITRPVVAGAPTPLAAPLAGPYQVNDAQMDQFSKITDTVFRARLAQYLQDVWADDAGGQGEAALQDLIGAAIGDCARLQVCREMDVVIMSLARLRVPELVGSDEFWRILLEQRPNPNARAGTFLSAMMLDMEPAQKNAFYQRVNGWWDYQTQEAAE